MSELRETAFEPYVGISDDGSTGVVEFTLVTDSEETALEHMRDLLEMLSIDDGPIVCDGRVWLELDPSGDVGGYIELDEWEQGAVRAWRFDTSACG